MRQRRSSSAARIVAGGLPGSRRRMGDRLLGGGDALTFSATSSDETRVQLDSSADTIRIKGASEGSARVTATATDVPGLSTAQAFDVTVRPFVAPVGFDIELEFTSSVSASSVSASARDVTREAASTWESILANTELSDVNFNRRVSCAGVTTTGAVGTVDELLILFTAESIDGPSGTLGYAGPCTVRTSNGLPGRTATGAHRSSPTRRWRPRNTAAAGSP